MHQNKYPKINPIILNIEKYKLYPPPIGSFFEKSKIIPNLNFSSLEPILFQNKKAIIGDGAFSKVFLYQHKKSKIKYAIKIMNIPLVLKKSNNKDIILNEISIQSKISHPNIIRLYNYFKDKQNKNYFLILEYASKGTLFDYIHLKRGLSESNSFYYFIQAVNAIYFLHTNKIIHRDLKPENLLINHENILKLCDFGWSVHLNNNKRETFCGTVEYMAPEIVKNEGYDFSIDVWSLGVLLYELIHSHSPFVVKDLDINKIENNIISKGLKFKKEISNECKDLIQKLLAKSVKKRIKVKDIYQHPFILRYINMINHSIHINQINFDSNNNKNIRNNSDNKNDKNIIINKINDDKNSELKNDNKYKENNESNLKEIPKTFSEFDTIPNEPEPKKINGNFDKIVRKLTKINIFTVKNNTKNKEFQIIKKHIDKNIMGKITYKKSLSFNNLKSQEDIINKNKKKETIQQKKDSNKDFLKENMGIKKNIKHQMTLGNMKNEILKTNKKNLIKGNYNKENRSKRINNIIKTNKKNNISPMKKILTLKKNEKLITSYKVKSKKKDYDLVNKKLINNYTSTNIHNLSKLNKSENIKNIMNCKSISYIKMNNNKSLQNFSLNSNSNSNINNICRCKNKIKRKRNIHIKHINTLSKKANYSLNDINKMNSNNNIQKKLTLNLSNINVINVYNNSNLNEINSNSLNVPKIIQKINTFFIRDKPSNNLIINNKNNFNKKINNNINNIEIMKSCKKPSCLKLRKSKENILNNSERKYKDSQNTIKKKQKSFMSYSNINNSKKENKNKYIRNIKLKPNNISPLNLSNKKK